MNQWIESDEGFLWSGAPGDSGTWALRFRDVTPGLYFRPVGRNSWYGPFLGVLGLTACGRGEEGDVSTSCLTHTETIRESVSLEFMPPEWHETTLKFTWSGGQNHEFDLIAEISTRSVGMLREAEVGIVSAAWGVPESVPQWLVGVRDEAASMRSIDGREPRWNKQVSAFGIDETVAGFGPDRAWPPTLLASRDAAVRFLETSHPHDISRRYRSTDGHVQRTWMLGYDMERGIVLRARARGRFVSAAEDPEWSSVNAWQEAFLAAPLPLER